MLLAGLVIVVSYLVGAIPFGYLIARRRGVDLFRAGSGNIGATNVGRVLGRRFGILVFALDFAKGALPVAVALWLGGRSEVGLPPSVLPVAAGLAAFLGHLFPVYLGFRGGKGVATGAGVVAVLLPLPALGALFVWVAVASATRIVSLASLAAAMALCGFRLWLTPGPFTPDHRWLTLFCFLAAGLVVVRHRSNIVRLLHGTESSLKDSPTMLLFSKTLHVLTLGLWFGMAVFFTFVVGLTLFETFWALAERPADQRPLWLPLPPEFGHDPAGSTALEPLFPTAEAVRREQGTRVAGTAVSPLFDWYFLLQGICGLLALATALGWPRLEPTVRAHKVRAVVLLLAVVTVLVGWPLERKVSEVRTQRNAAVDAVLTSDQPTQEQVRIAADLARDFGRWHLYSLFLNFGTCALVAVAMALAARLPSRPGGAS